MTNLPTLPITAERGNEGLASAYLDHRDYDEGYLQLIPLEAMAPTSRARAFRDRFFHAQSSSEASGTFIAPLLIYHPSGWVSSRIDDIHHQLRLEQLKQEMDQFANVDLSTRSSNNPQSFWERLHAEATSLEVTEQTLAEEREQGRLANKLHAEFEAEVLQDGEHHPAEDLIQEALRTSQERVVLQWFETWAVDASQPSFAASLLRCLGRQERFGTDSWRTELIRKALSVDDVDIRDAAVQAVESWEDQELIQVLMGHDEPEHWLKDYIQGVIYDLTH